MKKLILTVVLLVSMAHMANADILPTLDLDALLFSSDSVVEGRITGEHTIENVRTNPEFNWTELDSADVKVKKTLMGADLNGKTVNIGALAFYKKSKQVSFVGGESSPIIKQARFSGSNLEKGDRAIFFLEKLPPNAQAHSNSETWIDRTFTTDSDFWVIGSGVGLLRRKSISGFIPRGNSIVFNEIKGDLRANFDKDFAASLARVAELKTKLAAPLDVKNRAFFADWETRREEYQKLFIGYDTISEEVINKLALIDAKEAKDGKSDG